MRYIALILMLIAPSWAWAEPERMECSIVADHYFTVGEELKLNQEEKDKKLYISIQDDVLAINYHDSSAYIFKQNHAYSVSSLGLRNRKFISVSDFTAEVIVVAGEECSLRDKEPRNATWMMTFGDGFISNVMSCNCD